MFRGSAIERILACHASEVLPHSDDVEGAYAGQGRATHEYLERVDPANPSAALAEVPEEYRDQCELLDLDALPLGPEYRREVSMSFDVTSGVASEAPRDYAGLPHTHIPCTADVVGVSEDSVYIADYKTGRGARQPAGKAPQLLFGALCATRIHGKNTAIVEYIDLSNPTRPYRDTATVGYFELEEFAAEVTAAWVAVEQMRQGNAVPTEFNEGSHCRYCPAFEACPAKRKMLARIESTDLEREVEMSWAGSLTPASAPTAYQQWQMVKQLEKRMSDIIYSYASQHDIVLPDGKRFGKRTVQGNEKLDGQVAYDVIAAEYGAELALETVQLTCTKAAMKRSLKTVCPTGGVASAERALLKRIKDEGGISRKQSERIEEYKADV